MMSRYGTIEKVDWTVKSFIAYVTEFRNGRATR